MDNYITLMSASKQTGLKPEVIRYIGDKGSIGHIHRRVMLKKDGVPRQRNRVYSQKQVDALTLIKQLRDEGFTLPVAVKKAWNIVRHMEEN